MPPTRTRKVQVDLTLSTMQKGKRKINKKKPKNEDTTPGVQKIKSSLRQTRRLLAKDNLAADVRVETERRLQALEADLVKAQTSRKERTMALKYHKVKFFERQKLVRKINQVKRKLSEESSDSLQSTLSELRVDLNYVLHYPKAKRYSSLFPPEARKHSKDSSEHVALPHDSNREAVRSWVRSQMETGELPRAPEDHLELHSNSKNSSDWGQSDKGRSNVRAKDESRGKKQVPAGIEEDDFFSGSAAREGDTDDDSTVEREH